MKMFNIKYILLNFNIIYNFQQALFKFQNRLEFRSPGRLTNTVSIEKIRHGVSYARNPVILKFMENLRYIDQLGRGIPMVILEAAKIGGDVTFEEVGEEFVVRLYFPKV
jgi:ATP-dependent DNA helicase RecG